LTIQLSNTFQMSHDVGGRDWDNIRPEDHSLGHPVNNVRGGVGIGPSELNPGSHRLDTSNGHEDDFMDLDDSGGQDIPNCDDIPSDSQDDDDIGGNNSDNDSGHDSDHDDSNFGDPENERYPDNGQDPPLPGVGYRPLNSTGSFSTDVGESIEPCKHHPLSREHNEVCCDLDYYQFRVTEDDLQVDLNPW
jgi:hypothetical protein